MVYKFPLSVPTYDNKSNTWTKTTFETLEEFRDFSDSLFKEPGKYEFDETSFKFNEKGNFFKKNKFYCNAPYLSKDYVKFWDFEKEKCRNGVIYKNGKKIWYLTRDYYMWLNFLPIYDKEESDFGFPKVRDAQYHMAIYELRAELHYKHVAILKKRQIASSYFHMAKLINAYCFERGSICKIGASRQSYIDLEGSWRFLSEYRDFLNKHTAWYRPSNPDKVLNWQQRVETVSQDGKRSFKGNKSVLTGTSFEKDPTAGVGGPCTYFFHEEGGIAPRADKTFYFMKPALKSGTVVTTGVFMIAGSVGELDKCEPLQEILLNPGSDFLSVTTNLLDETGVESTTALFIPEQWSMLPFIDKYGNSLVEEALQAIKDQRKIWKEEYTPEKYQYEISQHPTNIREAFDVRTESKFPVGLIKRQIVAIENNEVYVEYLDISRNAITNQIEFNPSRRAPLKFPVDKKLEDKRGCVIVHERPDPNPEWGTYYASIDPVGEGKTTTSESLFCIHIYKSPIEKTIHSKEGSSIKIFGDKLVATWTGRFDDINDTHEYASMLLEVYNAWAIVENNISLFIQYMIHKKKQRYLVPKDQILFLQELKANQTVYSTYGWKNVGTIFSNHLLSYAIEFCKEVIDQEVNEDGTVIRTHYGVERIHDKWLLEEMLKYRDGLNVDRLVSFSALIAFRTLLISNRGYKKMVEYKENFQNTQNLYKLVSSPFSNLEKNRSLDVFKQKNRGFKNIK